MTTRLAVGLLAGSLTAILTGLGAMFLGGGR